MGKHLGAEIKYNYVMRYQNGESASKIGREINANIIRPQQIIFQWKNKYNQFGYDGLKSRTGLSKNGGRHKK